mmetsp:Transcript_19813/g.50082  ORF Transcript_19813/g.50082 Transcript_19813/m.50082 type:complete len:212 (-) Transcript_19813:9-644(-)
MRLSSRQAAEIVGGSSDSRFPSLSSSTLACCRSLSPHCCVVCSSCTVRPRRKGPRKARPVLQMYRPKATRHSPRTCGHSAFERLGSSSFFFFLAAAAAAGFASSAAFLAAWSRWKWRSVRSQDFLSVSDCSDTLSEAGSASKSSGSSLPFFACIMTSLMAVKSGQKQVVRSLAFFSALTGILAEHMSRQMGKGRVWRRLQAGSALALSTAP